MVAEFQNPKIQQLTHSLFKNTTNIRGTSLIEGVSIDTWGILMNALIGGITVQALLLETKWINL